MNLCVRQATVAKNNMAEVELNSINKKNNNNHRFKSIIEIKIVYQLILFH